MTDDKKLSVVDGSYVNKGIVESLEEMLSDAKEGKIIAFALCAVAPNAMTFNTFNANSYPINILGELRCLERELMDQYVNARLHRAGEEY